MKEKASPAAARKLSVWRGGIPFMSYKGHFSRIVPVATLTSCEAFYPGGSSGIIFNNHILEAACLGQKAARDVTVRV